MVVGAVLIGVLVVVLVGCGCVVWSDRGGPPWARTVGNLTVRAGDALRGYYRRNRRGG
ncbi:hypothetical protein ACFQ6N_07120 [Kitasatospora sp. NPDC056446]|uniref:hypothetical protein n=1 Tax=Kitasatospora sp. NPDC056446 TaxID=3345819 RepID=UPI0036D06435